MSVSRNLLAGSGRAVSKWLPAALAIVLVWASLTSGRADTESETVRVQIVEAVGNLTVEGEASTPVYTAYFHVPVPNRDQVPLFIEVESSQLIDYRFIRTTGRNVLVAARMHSAPTASLNWRAWTLVNEQFYSDLPEYTPMTALADLPDSLLQYLQPTATAQVECAPVQEWVAGRSGFGSLNFVADLVNKAAAAIPFEFDHSPTSFCAYYTLNWGNSCTGHAHVATALLRGMGIPARTKLSMITWYDAPYDMHWTTEYYVPGYGWVTMEPTTGDNPLSAQQQLIMYTCEPADEFPLIFDHGIDGFWHTSDPALGGRNPIWHLAHQVVDYTYAYTTAADRDELTDLARAAFDVEVEYRGVTVPPVDMDHLATGLAGREAALERLLLEDVSGALDYLCPALAEYEAVEPRARTTRFASGFESGPLGWSHGGRLDPWEWGAPGAPGPLAARSGANCWATGLDQEYGNGVDAWLDSPPINLEGLASAQLEFWAWILTYGTYVAGDMEGLSLEITTDGVETKPLCGVLRGGNDDPAIPVVTGWARMDLDLTPYVGQTVQIRFRFTSDGSRTWAGAYIDDMKITGLASGPSPVADETPPGAAGAIARLKACPNPFNPQTRITFELRAPRQVRVSVYDMAGKRVAVPADRVFAAGLQGVDWDGCDRDGRSLPSGAYVVRVQGGGAAQHAKLMLLR